MYAIVETSGRQFRVEPGMTITVDRRAEEVGTEITLDRVLLIQGDELKLGAPTVEGAAVTAKVVGHPRGEKVITRKFTRRQRTRRKIGFRASLTHLEIVGIDG